MADKPQDKGASFPLPDPLPEFLAPPGGEDPRAVRAYFDPERWDEELVQRRPEPDDRDPVQHDKGRLEGRNRAALFLSDFHLADGTAGGDDFLDSHLRPEEDLGGLLTGFYPA